MKPRSNKQGERFIRLSLVLPFLEHVEGVGIGTQSAFSNLALKRSDAQDPDVFVHSEVVYGLINTLASLARDPFLGCHVGERFDLRSWPPLSKMFEEHTTLGDFFTGWITSVPEHASSVKHELLIGAEEAVYKTQRPNAPTNSPGQTDGFGCALIFRVIDLAEGVSWRPGNIRVGTMHPEAFPPAYKGAYIVESDTYGLEISFPVGWLRARLSVQTQTMNQEKPIANGGVSLISAVRGSIQRLLPDRDVTVENVANTLGLEKFRLKRALTKVGTNVSSELREVRLMSAKDALSNSEITISDLSAKLGFADTAHFSRFFRKQTGRTPSEFRRNPKCRGSELGSYSLQTFGEADVRD